MPYERGPIFDFIQNAASLLRAEAEVLDVGAGEAPYKELFAHTNYRTLDWEHSVHEAASDSDFVGAADSIPVADETFDAVLLTQVLEHVREPSVVLRELHRILKREGWLFLTAPLVWELHELPYDFYRYTENGLRYLVEEAGFVNVEIAPRGNGFTTIAQLMRNLSAISNRVGEDSGDVRQREAAERLVSLAHEVAALAPLDESALMPLGYSVKARRR
jgi:SAM-dependent methyltransferase